MEHLNQNCGYSCGPTSLKMIMQEVGYRNDLGIQDILKISHTKIGGTFWSRMSWIIRKLNIKHKVISVTLNYFKNQPSNKVWMLSIFYGKIKHWVVLEKYEKNMFKILDPADTIKYFTYNELYSDFESRNSIAIEFDLNDFIGTSENFETHDKDGDFVMNYVEKYNMMPVEDSNFIFNKLGKKVSTIEEISDLDNFETDYIYGVFDEKDTESFMIILKKYLFAIQPEPIRSEEKVILLRYK